MGIIKPDSQKIIDFIDKLENEPNIKNSERSFWPSFIFHYTPLQTAVKILQDEKLKSRYSLEENNELTMSIGSRVILERTAPHKIKFVRLYFRPRTPTQFHIEGIRTKPEISGFNVHCPIPIFFLFESRKLLVLPETLFTNGNFSKGYVKIGNSAEFLESLPFEKIYHLGPYNPRINFEIKFHRCAEVLYPNELDLSTLKYICCRSEAEKDTLLHQLPFKIWSDWHSKAIVSRTRLFEAKWTYLEKVQLLKNEALLYFSPDSKTPGPFLAKLEIVDNDTGKIYTKEIADFYTNTVSAFKVNIPRDINSYMIKLCLDDNLCYQNSFSEDNLPF
jgi:hypothetical protein